MTRDELLNMFKKEELNIDIFQKNRDRVKIPTFANINLLGKCNVDCYFCLGKDIPELLNKHNQLTTHFNDWKNYGEFKNMCKEKEIENIYITGQNTDSLLYKYLDELIIDLKNNGFNVGIRTNGYLALKKQKEINLCSKYASVGYSIHTLNPDTSYQMIGTNEIPDWEKIFAISPENCRASIVVTRYNVGEFNYIVDFLSKFKNVRYIQARRVSTDKRKELLEQDASVYEDLFSMIKKNYECIGNYFGAEQYMIKGKEVVFWRTVKTNINSINYFTDGTLSEKYFVVEGYEDQNKGE